MEDYFWLAILAFIPIMYNFWQKRYDFLLGRKSIVIVIHSEIKETKNELDDISWSKFKDAIQYGDKVLLVVSNDIRSLDKMKIEKWQLPSNVVSSIISFQNSIYN